MNEDLRRLAYCLAALTERDLLFHGRRDDWYRMLIFVPGLGKNLYMPSHKAKELVEELLGAKSGGIRRVPTSAVQPGWEMFDIKISELTS